MKQIRKNVSRVGHNLKKTVANVLKKMDYAKLPINTFIASQRKWLIQSTQNFK